MLQMGKSPTFAFQGVGNVLG